MRLAVRILSLLLVLPLFARGGEVDVKHIIFDHLGDSYSWHISGHTAVHLPVIVIDKKGWHIFSSARLENGASWEGFQIASEGEYAGKIVDSAGVRPLDISLTKNALGLLINSVLLLFIIVPVALWYRRGRMDAPGGFRGAVEVVAEYVQDEIIAPCIGEGYRKYVPYLLTLFFFILVNNLMGLVPFFPGGANITGNIAVTAFLAVVTFLIVNISGTKEYWKEIFWPEVPTWLKIPAPIMPAVELVGVFTKPFALMIRLFANIFAGHTVILGLMSIIFMTASMGAAMNAGMTVVAVLFSIFMFCLELLVAFIQAYVFTLLSAMFIGLARVKHEH